jgi:AcrR family transcriptional regulator
MSAAPTRRKRGAGHELRDVVVHAATDLLAEVGDVDALTMRAVATAAGVTAPSVYRHFPDKQALVRTVITERFHEFANQLRAAATTAGDEPLARLHAMAEAYVAAGLAKPGHYRVLFSATNAGPVGLGLDPNVEHPGAASHRDLVEAVAACIPAATRADTALALATELWASLHGIVDLRVTKPEMPWPDPATLVHAALAAIRACVAVPIPNSSEPS